MPTISYEVSLKNINSFKKSEAEATGVKFGTSVKSSIPGELILGQTNPLNMSNGWLDKPSVYREGNYIRAEYSRFISDNRLISTELNGLAVVADAERYINSAEYLSFIGPKPTMGIEGIGTGRYSKSFLFRRKEDKVEIYKQFNYVSIDIETEDLDSYTELELGNGEYVLVFKREKPYPISELKDSSLQLDLSDYLLCSLDPHRFIEEKGIEEENFFEMCDTLTIQDLNVQEWHFAGTDITLKTKYFPIYKHIAVIARFENGYREITVDYYKNVDIHRGIVTIDGDFIKNNTLGEFKSFNLFYGVVPMVFLRPDDFKILEAELLSEYLPLTYKGIDNNDQEGSVTIPEPLISISRNPTYESQFTDINIPRKYKRIFVDPSSPIMINGEIVSSERNIIVDNNNGLIKLEIAAAEALLDLVEPINFVEYDKFKLDTNLSTDQAAVFGLFNYNDKLKRLSLMASSNSNWEEYEQAIERSGWGDRGFGTGGYSQGYFTTYGTSLVYTTATENAYDNISRDDFSYRVIPERDGYDIILPAWADRNTIKITEVGLRQLHAFNKWRYIEPDIILLDKDHMHPTRTYNIAFEPVAFPYLTNADTDDDTFSLIINKDPNDEYNTFQGLYVLGNKTITLRFGYFNSIGDKIYFNNEIEINQIITREFMQRILTKEQSVLF